ncbi:MAG: hypothetical protein ABIE94_03330 [archaeon]
MTKASTPYSEIAIFFEFAKENMKSFITQIINSKEFSSSTNKISSQDKKKYLKDIDLIVDKVIDKEIKYYITKYNVKSAEDYAKVINGLSPEKIDETKSKFCKEVLAEISSKK